MGSVIFKILFLIFNILIVFLFFEFKEKIFLRKKLIVYSFIFNILVFIFAMLIKFDILKNLTSVVGIKNLIINSGAKGVIVFLLIQILEVVCLPIPSIAIIIVGTLIYGPWMCFLLCSFGVVVGSIIAYLIGKSFGSKFLISIFGKNKFYKYNKILNYNGKYLLALVFLFPFLPDDLMCFVAGVSQIKTKDFIIVAILTKPIGVFITTFLGSSFKIPFKGFGLVFWIIIFILIFILIIIGFKNKSKIKVMLKKVTK